MQKLTVFSRTCLSFCILTFNIKVNTMQDTVFGAENTTNKMKTHFSGNSQSKEKFINKSKFNAKTDVKEE